MRGMFLSLQLFMLGLGTAASAEPPLIPLEDLARGPQVGAVKISPDGHYLAKIETIGGRGAIIFTDLDGKNRRILARDPNRSIDNVNWSGDGRFIYYLQDAGGNEGFHLYRVDPSTSAPAADLTPFKGVSVELVTHARSDGHDVFITLDRRDPQWPDAFRLDLSDGTLSELTRNNGRITSYFADGNGRIVAAESIRPDGMLDILASQPDGDWRAIYSAPLDERFKSLQVNQSGTQLIARSNRNASRDELVALDLKTGAIQPQPTPACGQFDVEDLAMSGDGVAGVSCTTDRSDFFAFSPVISNAVKKVRKLVGKGSSLALESRDRDDGHLVFFADRGNLPGRFVLVDSGRARFVGRTRPWLEHRALAKTKPVWFSARDGQRLLAYVTRPLGAVGPGPAVIAIHGGPWSRDTGGFDSTTQMLANRGYTVIQVNFRGSTGLGKATFEAGVREFGRKMSDDIDDVAGWAVNKRIVNADRICLLGGSYGGYATLIGLTRRTRAYRCGVDYAGPVNLVTLMEAFPPSWSSFLPRSWYRFVGRPDVAVDHAEMLDRSPLTHLDKLNSPLLVFQGVNDPRVTQAQSDAIICRLRERKINVDYLLAENEGHSFANEETSLAVNRATELFFAKNLGGRAQKTVTPLVSKTLDELVHSGSTIKCTSEASVSG